ncbi:MAG: O-antigen ligase family protein [bacterium]
MKEVALTKFKTKYIPIVISYILLIFAGYALKAFPVIIVIESILLIIFIALFFTNIEATIQLLIITRPLLGLTTFVIIFPLSGVIHGGINLAAVLSIFIIWGGVIYILLILSEFNVLELPILKPYILFLIICLISISVSGNLLKGLSEWLKFVSPLIMYILIVSLLKRKEQIMRLIYAIFFSTFIPVMIGFYQFFTGTGDTSSTFGFNRIFATFMNPNSYSVYLMIPLSIAFTFLLQSGIKKPGYSLLSLVLGVSIFLTFTRTAWIGVLFMILTISILKYRRLLIIMPLILAFLIVVIPVIPQRFSDIFNPLSYWRNPLETRFWLWQGTFSFFFDKPFLGYGLGAFESLALEALNSPKYAHNDYLRLLLETGILGLGAYLLLLFTLIKDTFKTYQRTKEPYFQAITLGFISVFVAFIIMNITENLITDVTIQWYFWIYAAMVHSIYHIEQREVKNHEDIIGR